MGKWPGKSLDHIVSNQQEIARNRKAQLSRSLQINDKLECGGLLHRQLRRLGPFEDFFEINSGRSGQVGQVYPVGHEASELSEASSLPVVTASFDKTARLWDILPTTQELVSHAKAAVPRCLIPAQRNSFFLPPEPPLWCIELEKWPYDTTVWKQWLSDFRAGKSRPPPAAE